MESLDFGNRAKVRMMYSKLDIRDGSMRRANTAVSVSDILNGKTKSIDELLR